MIAAVLVWCGIAYQLLVIIGALSFRKRLNVPNYTPPVSILKPVHGRDPNFYNALRSHALQQYPRFELVFGISRADDPAHADINRLRAEFANLPVRVIATANDAPNQKVGALEILAREAIFPTLLVNDADIVVKPDYLKRVIGLLADDSVGLVTCLYTGRGESLPAKTEALGIATEFAPSVLVARLLSSSGFAFGSTMAFRKRELDAIGGFASIRDYLADDYQLGARIAAQGKSVALSDSVVETSLGAGNWTDIWSHQVRWSRTIRVSRPAGYAGYAVTHTTFWCLAAAVAGKPEIAWLGLLVRLTAAAVAMRSTKHLLYVPFRDLFGFAVWCAGIAGTKVQWRGITYKLSKQGRITPLQ